MWLVLSVNKWKKIFKCFIPPSIDTKKIPALLKYFSKQGIRFVAHYTQGTHGKVKCDEST